MFEEALQQAEDHERARVADVDAAVDGRPAGVDADAAGVARAQRQHLAAARVVQDDLAHARGEALASCAGSRSPDAATPSPRPTKPIPSPVVAFTLTRCAGRPSACARRARISSRWAPSLGASITPCSRRSRSPGPAAMTRVTTPPEQHHRVGVAVALVAVGEVLADVAEPAAPSSASITAWASTSASECPSRPRSCGISTPPRISRRPASEPVGVVADPAEAHRTPVGRSARRRRARRSKTHSSLTPTRSSSSSARS